MIQLFQQFQKYILISSQMETEPKQQCDNCRQFFPDSKIATHFGYCRRNIKKCQVCGEMYDINSKEEHEQQFHKKQKCTHCKKEFSLADYKKHEQNCELKAKFCQYCELNVPVAGFQTHFKACQSRTKPCSKCNKSIMNKDYIGHIISCTGIVEQPKRPNNYAEYINQIQKKQQIPTNSNNRINSRQKQQRIGFQKPKQQRNYANIIRPLQSHKVQVKRIEPKVNVYYPQRAEQKKQSKGYIYHQQRPQQRKQQKGPIYYKQQPKRQQHVVRREEVRPIKQQYVHKKQQIPVKKQQIKKYSGIVNAPISHKRQEHKQLQYKHQEYKAQQHKPQEPKQQQIKPPQQYQYRQSDNSRTSGNREPPRVIPTSNKQIVINQTNQPYQPKHYTLKQSQSKQRVNGVTKKQQQNRIKYANQNINPKRQNQHARIQQNKYKVPVAPKYQPIKYQVPQNYQRENDYDAHNYNFQLSAQEQQLQQIILQSMSQQSKNKNVGLKNIGVKNITQKVPISHEIPYIQGQDIMNQSFIEKQRAIQQQFFKKARR